MDFFFTGRRIHLGYLIMMHMISCCESTTQVLPYGRFLTKVFKDIEVDLIRETYFEAPNGYDTYDDLLMGRMNLRRPSMVLGLDEQRDHQHRFDDRERHITE